MLNSAYWYYIVTLLLYYFSLKLQASVKYRCWCFHQSKTTFKNPLWSHSEAAARKPWWSKLPYWPTKKHIRSYVVAESSISRNELTPVMAVHLGRPRMFVVFMESPVLPFSLPFLNSPFSLIFSDVGIHTVLYPLGVITFLLSPSTPISTWLFFHC